MDISTTSVPAMLTINALGWSISTTSVARYAFRVVFMRIRRFRRNHQRRHSDFSFVKLARPSRGAYH
ncbi:hypothetical protein EXIGLDRAFT_720904 [Exidia glandulosa HHB12029]|uniref:Uncharacterized protein n=1 Tax=Exidia glandulosa HHB12029 TaxID=1314781 RepID=A0A165NFK0_EXIGL|nr:hypothetical protein EXIGLDRAFT_720904 [Exidia glandulosa HHB12029]